jgi:hypothetical protein
VVISVKRLSFQLKSYIPIQKVAESIKCFLEKTKQVHRKVQFYITEKYQVGRNCPSGQGISARFACGYAKTRSLLLRREKERKKKRKKGR